MAETSIWSDGCGPGLYSNPRTPASSWRIPMLIGYVSDEYYAALADVSIEFTGPGDRRVAARREAGEATRLPDLPDHPLQ